MGGLFSPGQGNDGGVAGPTGGLALSKLPIIGGLFPSAEDSFKQQQMQQAGREYSAYRPELAQARENVMRQKVMAMQPMNNAMGAMYGPGAQMDTSQMFQSPMSARMGGIGSSLGMPGGGGGGMGMPGMPGMGGMPNPMQSFGQAPTGQILNMIGGGNGSAAGGGKIFSGLGKGLKSIF